MALVGMEEGGHPGANELPTMLLGALAARVKLLGRCPPLCHLAARIRLPIPTVQRKRSCLVENNVHPKRSQMFLMLM